MKEKKVVVREIISQALDLSLTFLDPMYLTIVNKIHGKLIFHDHPKHLEMEIPWPGTEALGKMPGLHEELSVLGSLVVYTNDSSHLFHIRHLMDGTWELKDIFQRKENDETAILYEGPDFEKLKEACESLLKKYHF